MKTAQVLITRNKVHDGLGGKWMAGQTTPPLPYENAAKIVSAGAGQFVDGHDPKEAEAVVAEVKQRTQAETAATRMKTFDELPKTIRELAREHGNEVVERYHAGENAYALKREYSNE